MLQTIRDKSQGLIASIILIFVCITFALWGIHNYFNGAAELKPVAKVNGEKVTQQQFDMAFNRFRQQQLQQNANLFSSQVAVTAAKQQLLDSLVTSTVLTQAAKKSGFAVSSQLMELEIANMPIFQVNGYFSKARFEQLLNQMMYTQEQFLEALNQSMLLAQVRAGFIATGTVLPYQVSEAIRLVNQKRSFAYILIPASQFSQHHNITEQQVQQYYDTHHAEFILPAEVSLDYLTLSIPELVAKLKPTDMDLMQYYQDNINHYTIPKQWQLAHILFAVAPDATATDLKTAQQKAQAVAKALQSGEAFSTLAAQNSDDTSTAKSGGVIGTVDLLQLDPDWQRELVNLKPGEVSVPFKTQQGYEIVKVMSTTPAVVKSYASIKDKVKEDYLKQTANKQFADLSDQLANLTFEHPNSLEPAAQQLNLPIQSTELFTQQGGSEALTKNLKVITAAFSNEVMNQGNNSDIIQVSDDQVVVIRIKQKVAARLKPLAEVKTAITAKLMQQAAAEDAKQLAKNIIQDLNEHKTLAQVAAKNGLTVQTVEQASRNNNSHVSQNLVVAAFNLGLPTKETVAATVVPLAQGDSAVVQLLSVQDADPNKDLNTQHFYTLGMERSAGMLNYSLYVDGLKHAATIKYFNEVNRND